MARENFQAILIKLSLTSAREEVHKSGDLLKGKQRRQRGWKTRKLEDSAQRMRYNGLSMNHK